MTGERFPWAGPAAAVAAVFAYLVWMVLVPWPAIDRWACEDRAESLGVAHRTRSEWAGAVVVCEVEVEPGVWVPAKEAEAAEREGSAS